MRALLVLALLMASLAACARRDSQVVTANGETFVVFHGLDQACVHRGIVKELNDFNWTITATSGSQIVARQPAPAWINTAVLLTSFDPPQVQIVVTLQPSGRDLRALIESSAIVAGRGTAERVEPIAATPQMTAVFNNSVRRIERECGA
jgi:hypothetical protein